MHQSTTPSLSQTIWPRWASRQFVNLLIVQTLVPVTFGYSLRSEVIVMTQLRRWKWLWRSHWHAHTRGLPWCLPEVVGTVKQVHCSRWRLLRRGLEFHVCPINKSAHTKKAWKLIASTSYNGLLRMDTPQLAQQKKQLWKIILFLYLHKFINVKIGMHLKFLFPFRYAQHVRACPWDGWW